MNLKDLFDQFQRSAFRLERLPVYRVPQEVEALEHFSATGKVQPGFNDAWADIVRGATKAGKSMKRLRLLSEPLTSYERFELQAYEAGLDAGEDIRVGKASEHPVTQDFWLFDDKWVASMNYAGDGAFLGADVREATLAELRAAQKWVDIFEASPKVRDRYPRE